MSSSFGHSRPVQHICEPARFWIGYSPRTWRSVTDLWSDLANARLEGYQRRFAPTLTELDADGLDDMFYLPPVDPELREQRNQQAEMLVRQGITVLIQAVPGEQGFPAGAHVVYDLLQPLLAGEIERLLTLPAGSTAAWPLIPGLTDPAEICDEGCALLASCGVTCVQAITLELSPLARRRLAEGREDDVFDAVFHSVAKSERELSRIAAQHGLEIFMRRPEIKLPSRFLSNRTIATQLSLVAELWTRLEKSVSQGQAFLRAARGAATTHHHLTALAEEKNLKVLSWLDTRSIDLVKEIVDRGRNSLFEELLAEYLGKQVIVPCSEEDEEPATEEIPDSILDTFEDDDDFITD